MSTFYNRQGAPLFYTEDNCHLFSFKGVPMGYIDSNSLYNFRGKHLGWLENGWILDPKGNHLFFSDAATGGPVKPMKKLKPSTASKKSIPLKSSKQFKPSKPLKRNSWSDMELEEFFAG